MRIGIDALKILSSQPAGVENYLINLLDGLKTQGINEEFVLYKGPIVLNESFSRHFVLPLLINREKLDVIHFPDHILPVLPIKTKKIITISDITFSSGKHPEYYNIAKRIYKQALTPRSVNRADKIIAVSESTKIDLIKTYNINADKIEVVYNGVSEKFSMKKYNDNDKKGFFDKFGFNFANYILFVGTIEPRKNIHNMLEAYKLFSNNLMPNSSYGLVICGKPGWLCDEDIKQITNVSKNHKVVYLKYVNLDELIDLYNMSTVFVYPSFYEGFGFPLVEAMACGIPVITSNVSSMPEIVGDAAIKIDPKSPEQISNALSKVISNYDFRQQMISNGLKRAKLFSPQKMADNTLKVYRSVSQSN